MGVPLIGREREVTTVLRALADPACDGVLLVGEEAGVGATAVLDEVLTRLAADGRPANRIVASRGAATRPYAALAHVLPPRPAALGAADDPLAVFDSIRARVGDRGGGPNRFVTCVDELRWLDEQSLALLSTLLAGDLAFVVATIRAGEPVPEAVSALERSCAIRRVAIRRLGRDDTDACISQLLPGAVDGALAHALFSVCCGNPLFLREVILGGRSSNVIRCEDDIWVLAGRLTPTPRLASVLDAEIDGADAAELRVLELLAVCAPMDIRALERAGLDAAVVTLDERGLVDAQRDGSTIHVRIVRPLLAALLRVRMSPLRRRALLREAVAALGPYSLPGDQLRLAEWKLEAGLPVTGDELIAGARQARAIHDMEAVQRLTAAARRDAGAAAQASGEVLALQADALQALGRFDAATELLVLAEERASDDPARLAVALIRHRILLWSGIDAATANEILERDRGRLTDPVSRDLLLAAMCTTEAIAGRAAACIDVSERLESGGGVVGSAMAFPVALAECRLGHPRRGAQLARAARDAVDSGAEPGVPGHAATLAFAEGLALAEEGRFTEADSTLRQGYRDVVEQQIPHYQAWLTAGLARLALLRGSPGEAERWFIECRAVSRRIGFEPGERAADLGLVVCAGLAGDLHAVEHRGSDCTRRWEHVDQVWPDGPIAAAWVAFATGHGGSSAALLAAAAEAAERGELSMVNQFLHEAVRFGASSVDERLLDAADRAEGPLAAARADVVRGTCHQSVVALERAERAFSDLGVQPSAAEAAAQLATLYRRLGRARLANAAARRADVHRARAGRTGIPRLARPSAAAVLSAREEEVATLAASGLASKEISARLGISVRTVSNHLQNVYTKLGISGRDDLRSLLAAPAR